MLSRQQPRVMMLILEYFPVFSGHAVYLNYLIKKLRTRNIRPQILTADFSELTCKDNINGTIVYRFPFSQKERISEFRLSLRMIKALYRLRSTYDILHLHGHLDTYGLLTLFCKLFRKKIISQMVLLGSDDPLTILNTYKLMKLRYKILALGDAFICISRELAKRYMAAKLPTKKLHYIPQGVDTEFFVPVQTLEEKRKVKAALGLDHCKKVVLFVGAIVKRKGVDRLVDAWKNVQKHHPDAWLVLVGQHHFDEKDTNKEILNRFVKALCKEIRANSLNVILAGKSHTPNMYYQCADVFVLPSRKEGFGNVIIEAMACSLPVVVTYMDGVAEETVVHGKNGYIVRDDEQELSRRIIELLENPRLAGMLGKNGREHVCKYFSLDDISKKYADLYRMLTFYRS